MKRKLPPLNSLRAFEAAARHLSFTRAAEELFVTPAAISHQVKALEEWFGVQLFFRRNREILMTEAGQLLLPGARDAFDTLDMACQRILAEEATGELRVTCMPSFAASWLVPRLAGFRNREPDIDVLLSTEDRVVDFNLEPFDLGIRMGSGSYTDLESVHLLDEEIFPVCSPMLQQGEHPLKTPDDLVHHTLLHDDYVAGWAEWLADAGVTSVNAKRGPMIDNSAMLLQAAADGQGVAMARRALAQGLLDAGRLIRPFALSMTNQSSYYLVYPSRLKDHPKITAFRDWIVEEAAAERDRQPDGGDAYS